MFCSACGTTKIVEKPVPVEVIVVKYVPVPDSFLIRREKSTIPNNLTYGEAMQLWIEDRATLDVQNNQLLAIGTLDGQP